MATSSILTGMSSIGRTSSGDPPKFPKHFDGKRFYNPDRSGTRGWLDVLRWKLTSRMEPSPRFAFDVTQSIPPRAVEDGQLRITLINHSTVLLQLGGTHILTDPIWSERASPLTWIGPRRHRIPGVRREDLPRIDVVLLSHNHYDHLDLETLRWLAAREHPVFIVPSGVARLLRSQKIEPASELDWGETKQLATMTVHSVPAAHFSARGIFDRDKTLWCGYVIQSPNRMVYFAGDTAFGGHFSQIRDRFGAPSLSLLPIGAYKPRWFMSPVHMAPEEAVQAHQILGSATSIAIHHGTFQLTDESIDAAAEELSTAAPPDFLVLANGQSAVIP